MHDHALKEYQQDCLDKLARFSDEVRLAHGQNGQPVHDAFYAVTGRNFFDVPQMPGVPYVCLRVPTGGGKTLIAAHAVGTVAKRLGHQDRPLCLWVTPSTTIRDQTLSGLRDRNHPYHLALKEKLGVPLEVLTLEEALSANRSIMSSSAVIVVTTIQSYRIDEEANRRIYQDNGYLMDHFTALPEELRKQLTDPETGRVDSSLANVMRLRRPIVIMDEAHNARTKTSFDSLARMGPLAVLELTATPIQEHDPTKDLYASNVLHAVSALQLKREGMIKLPVDLESRENWLDVLAVTVEKRSLLAKRAAEWGASSKRYVRPIALIQAQPRSKTKETHTADKVKAALIEQLKVPAESIRIATGDKDDLGDEDLSKPDCPVNYVITVDKLREGWDCPFAYVLGSVGNVATETAVEQLLGRILRMPQATPTGVPELDRAYAVVQSDNVARTAANLADSMVNRCGFDKQSVGDALRVHQQIRQEPIPFVSSIRVTAAPDLSALAPAIQAKVKYEPETGSLIVHQPLTRDDTRALRDTLPAAADKAAIEAYWQVERPVGTALKNLDQYAAPVRVPQLAVRAGQRLFRFDPIELDEFSWDLNRCDPKFTAAEFSDEMHVGDHVLVDVTGQGAVRVGGVEEVVTRQGSFVEGDAWESPALVRWLDSELHRGGRNAGLPAAESQAWLNRVAEYLLTERGVALVVAVRKRHKLSDLIDQRITEHGRKQLRGAAQSLFAAEGERRLETTFDLPFQVLEDDYAPYRRYTDGPFTFLNHAFDLIGEMNEPELDCAKALDDHANVKRWLRNLSHESAGGFSLPLSPGRFFPDFIAELKDGRIAIVEYKGKHLAQNKDELHKKEVGEMWAARSGGKGVFVWVVDRDSIALKTALNAG